MAKKKKGVTKKEIIKDVSIAVSAAVAGALAAYEWEKHGMTKKTKKAVRKAKSKTRKAVKKGVRKVKKTLNKKKPVKKKVVRRKKKK